MTSSRLPVAECGSSKCVRGVLCGQSRAIDATALTASRCVAYIFAPSASILGHGLLGGVILLCSQLLPDGCSLLMVLWQSIEQLLYLLY